MLTRSVAKIRRKSCGVNANPSNSGRYEAVAAHSRGSVKVFVRPALEGPVGGDRDYHVTASTTPIQPTGSGATHGDSWGLTNLNC
jgi:hypothetical protein